MSFLIIASEKFDDGPCATGLFDTEADATKHLVHELVDLAIAEDDEDAYNLIGDSYFIVPLSDPEPRYLAHE